jgi:hypothetical protein
MRFLKELISLVMILIFKPKKKDIDKSYLGINCFFNVPELGTMEEQAQDIEEMGIEHVRILVLFDDDTQPSKMDELNLNFETDILNSLQENQKALLVISGAPSWIHMEDNKTRYFVRFCKLVMREFAEHPKVLGYQIGNEPNSRTFSDNVFYGFLSPEIYIKTLAEVYKVGKDINSEKLILMAASTSIVQNYRETIEYNERLFELGIEKFTDYYCIHYYGDRSFVNLLRPGGALRFLRRISKKILVTEVGERSFNNHIDYAKIVIPYLIKKAPNIERFYWYQYDGFGDTETFGLRNANGALSRLYAYLKK